MNTATLIFRKLPGGRTLVFGALDYQPVMFNDAAVLVKFDILKAEDRTEEYKGKSYPFILGQGIKQIHPGNQGITMDEAIKMIGG
jgi:hypothetical protein